METLKNTGLFLLAAFCMSIFFGCADGNEGSEGKNSDAAKVAAAKEALVIPDETDSDLDLPVTRDGVAISWASSDEAVISNDGLVTQQQYEAKVTLTATLAFGKAAAVKEFPVTVIAFSAEDEDAAKVAAAKEVLAIHEETDCDLDLPVTRDGVTISWVSSDEDVISNDGIVTRQLYDSQATLIATLTFGNVTDTKEFTVTVLALGAEDPDTATVAAAKEALAIPAETDSDLDLPLVLNGVAVSWASSDESVISNDGVVTRQLYDMQAKLTATLTLGSAVKTKEFTVTVIAFNAEDPDTATVAGAKEALAIPAETDSDLNLPLVLNGVAVSWASSDEGVISNGGVVTRQLYDAQATLTATLSLGSAVETKEFTVTVLSFTALEIAAKVASAKDALAIPAETDRDLDLPVDLSGVAVSWASSDEAVISNDGHVTRQLYDAQATLTATLTLGSAVETKKFTVTVTAVIEEEAELVELSYWLITSGATPNRIKMIYPDENAVFNCRVDNGLLFEYPDPYGPNFPYETLDLKNVNMPFGSTIVWSPVEINVKTGEILYFIDHAFFEIVIKLEENIIGYALFEVLKNTNVYPPDILKTVVFPQIDGEYQNISEEFVTAAIEKLK